MFAYVPTVPGLVSAVVSSIPNPLPSGHNASDYYSCGSAITTAWSFDGNSFTAPLPIQPTPTPPSSAQIAAAEALALLNTGIVLTSSSIPALNGTYAADEIAMVKLNSELVSVLTNGTFTNGSTTLEYFDLSCAPHNFPSIASFKDFATAIGAYVGPVQAYIDSGGTVGTLPTSNAISIP